MSRHWFEDIADHTGAAYLRYSFTKGTEQEVGFLVELLRLDGTTRVLDVGCGPGRHAHELARRGVPVVGLDISARFVSLATAGAPQGATFVLGDARALPVARGAFDVVLSLCQGGWGLLRGEEEDPAVLSGLVGALRPGGRAVLSTFSSYFQTRWLEDVDDFDAATGVNHERTAVKDEHGRESTFDLWTTCFTPRELRLLAAAAHAQVEAIWSVAPGDYARRPPDLDHPEWLIVLVR
jgi:SAM-dependent methyltransferase